MPERNEMNISLNESTISANEGTVTPVKDEKPVPVENAGADEAPKYNLSKFRLKRILNNNSVRKSISLLGTFPDVSKSDAAIVIFEKQAFRETDVATSTTGGSDDDTASPVEEPQTPSKPTYFSNDLKVHKDFVNNIYGSYQCVPTPELNGVKATVVYPATDKHIEKYSICQRYLINETPSLYKSVTLPYLQSSQFSLEWVYNILEHKQETERIIYEDSDPETGFILLPDLKWDGRNIETLYLLAITHKHGLKSLRDLRDTHLPLLRNIRTRAAEAIAKRYGLMATQLRMYFHYQPSFYHLHVHINPVRNDAPGIWCDKSHMLDTVINNLELLPDYYQRATLPFVVYDGNKLLDLFEDKLTVRKSIQHSGCSTDEVESKNINEMPQSKRIKLSEVDSNNIVDTVAVN